MKRRSPAKLTICGLALAAAAGLGSSLAGAARAAEESGFAPTAAPGGGFGAVGQWVLSGEANLAFHTSTGGGWDIRFQPSLDTFIAPSFSVGGVVTVAHASGGTTSVGLGPRAGYNLNFNEHIGWWPLVGVRVAHDSNSMQHTSSSSAAARVFAPFLYHIVPHFFAGLGPSFDLGLSDGHKTFGVDSIVGGWF
jgi:hypothetical protein